LVVVLLVVGVVEEVEEVVVVGHNTLVDKLGHKHLGMLLGKIAESFSFHFLVLHG